MHSHLARNMRQNLMSILKLDPEHRVRQRLKHLCLNPYCVFFGHTLLNRQHFTSIAGYRYRMLKMSRAFSVPGYNRPAVLQSPDFAGSGVNHRLDRQHHSFGQNNVIGQKLITDKVGHSRLFVHLAADSMPDKLFYHRKTR